ncbi:MAG: hypothetical protein GEU83_19990 [Pseudonocardiaceae bacterium]|nr:hypothetical protein [Pseudonocardiaceae bacterium]
MLTRAAGLLAEVDKRIRALITLAYAVCADETPLWVGPRNPLCEATATRTTHEPKIVGGRGENVFVTDSPLREAHRLAEEAMAALSVAAAPVAADEELLSTLSLCEIVTRHIDHLASRSKGSGDQVCVWRRTTSELDCGRDVAGGCRPPIAKDCAKPARLRCCGCGI